MTLKDRIVACYERDQSEGRIARSAGDIPTSYDAITAEWLTAILCTEHPGAMVTDFRLGARDDGTANRRRIHLSYNDVGEAACLPGSIFCKATHDLPHRLTLGISGGTHSEVTFYHEVRPQLDVETPSSIYAAYDSQSYNSIIVMEDIGDKVRFCDYDHYIDRDHARGQIRLLAALHGRFYNTDGNLAGRVGLSSWPQFFRNVVSMGQEEASNRGFHAAKDVIPTRLFARHDDIWPATVASVDRHERLPHTILHGDCHLKQWYVSPEGHMGLTDWQCSTIGNWARDLSYVLGTSLTVDDRRSWEQDLIIEYLDLLAGSGASVPGFDEAWLLYRQNMMSALNWWTGTLTPAEDMPEMQPEDATLRFIERLAHAADDLGSVNACLR